MQSAAIHNSVYVYIIASSLCATMTWNGNLLQKFAIDRMQYTVSQIKHPQHFRL